MTKHLNEGHRFKYVLDNFQQYSWESMYGFLLWPDGLIFCSCDASTSKQRYMKSIEATEFTEEQQEQWDLMYTNGNGQAYDYDNNYG